MWRWLFFAFLGLACAGCGISEAERPDPSVSTFEQRWSEFEACIEEGGYSIADLGAHARRPAADDITDSASEKHRAVRIEDADSYWDLKLREGECINRSGIGESAVGDPEHTAARTERVLAITECMRSRGWDEFPDPLPHPAPYDDGLVHERIDVPEEDEEREAFNTDFAECGDENGVKVVPGHSEEDGPDHGDHDH